MNRNTLDENTIIITLFIEINDKPFLNCSIAVLTNIGILFYYKYYDFTVININRIFRTNLTIKQIALPIGISFFTFQGMSYVLDVFMEKAEVQKNPFHVLLYISLFPQLIAGPIVRYSDINHQIENRAESLEKIASGISRFIIGLSKKVLISNSFAVLAYVFSYNLKVKHNYNLENLILSLI